MLKEKRHVLDRGKGNCNKWHNYIFLIVVRLINSDKWANTS